MEFVDGPSLSDVLRGGPIGVERAAALGVRLAEALAYAHHLGVVHRDVKPGNVLLDGAEAPRLADFGIARLADSTTLTASGVLVGTASYLAPEQLEGRHVGPAADVYSLGLVLLECSTGKRAYDGTPTEAALARLVRDPEVPDDLPRWWAELLRRMTSLGADSRPSAAEVRDHVQEALDSGASDTGELDVPGPAPTLRIPAPAGAGDTVVLERPATTRQRSVAGTDDPVWAETAAAASASSPGHVHRRAARDARRFAVAAAVVLAALVLGVLVALAVVSHDGGGAKPIPPALDRSLDRLEKAVQG
jgi:serine/threonine protein kinase